MFHNTIKSTYDKATANIILSGGNLDAFPLRKEAYASRNFSVFAEKPDFFIKQS